MEKILVEIIKKSCDKYRAEVALHSHSEQLSYENLLIKGQSLAVSLLDKNLSSDSIVMVKCSNSPSDFIALLAVWMIGGVVVPIHRSVPKNVMASIQKKARCEGLIDLFSLSNPIKKFKTEKMAPTVKVERDEVLNDAALVIFTSGSTGQPKGAVLSHSSLYGKLKQNQKLFNISSKTNTLLVLNNTFSFGIWVALITLVKGGAVYLHSSFCPTPFLKDLVRWKITFVAVVPTMIRNIFEKTSQEEQEFLRLEIKKTKKLDQVVIGGELLGERLSAELRHFISPAKLYDVYGLTETATSDFYLDPSDYKNNKNSIGKAFPKIDFRIVSDKIKNFPNQSGELQLRTPYMMSGYLGEKKLTLAAFHDGWFKTGDLAKCNEHGFVTITGRIKELIIRGGNKITPLEVEQALLRSAGVLGALVTGVPDTIMGQRIHALVVPKAGEILSASSIKKELVNTLEKFKHPDVFWLADHLPTGRTGKIDRRRFEELINAKTLCQLV